MNARNRRRLAATLGLAGLVGVGFAGTAMADDDNDPTTGFPSTQSPRQPTDSVLATGGQLVHDFRDLADGYDRPDGANGNEVELPSLDRRLVEGPLVGLIKDGPFQ